jgi:UDP-glucose 4-epimerase
VRVLAIGGTGFIGSYIVAELLRASHEVVVVGRNETPSRPLPEGVTYVQGSLGDRSLMTDQLRGVDAVLHASSTTVPSTGDRDPTADVTGNLLATLSLLDAMADRGVERLLFISSGGTIYGPPERIPVPETHRMAPTCSYGIVKAAIEMYIELYASRTGLRPVVIRASNPYGPRQGNVGVQGIISTFLNRVRLGEPLEVWGDGSTIRDYVFVEDMARLCVTALASDRTGTYNGGSGIGTSISEIVNLVREITGRDFKVIHKGARSVDVPVSVLDPTKARLHFGWSASTDLHTGIHATWEAMQRSSDAPIAPSRPTPAATASPAEDS